MKSRKSPNFVVGGGVFAIAMLSLLLSTGGAAAQASKLQKRPAVPVQQAAPAVPQHTKQDTKKATPGWTVHCSDAGQGLACKAVQSVALAKTRQLLASVTVTKPAANKNGTILLRLPLGIFNPAGVIVSIARSPSRISTG